MQRPFHLLTGRLVRFRVPYLNTIAQADDQHLSLLKGSDSSAVAILFHSDIGELFPTFHSEKDSAVPFPEWLDRD